MKRYLSEFFTEMKVPGKKECNACIANEPDLGGRSWTDIKNYVHNTLQTMRRRSHQHTDGNVSESPDAGVQSMETDMEDSSVVCSLTTVNPDHLRESPNCCMTLAPTNYVQELTSTYATLCSTSADMMHDSQPLISTFTPLNATDTQVVPTFTPHNTANALMPLPYESDSMIMPLSSYSQNATSMPPSSVYAPQDTMGTPLIPNFTTFTAPSTSMVPTFTTLSTSASIIPPYSHTLTDRSRPVVSSFTPLNHSSAPGYPAGLPPTTAQVVPTTQRPGVRGRAPVAQESTSAAGKPAGPSAKPQKRNKRLWSSEEQAAVRRQLGDLCKLVKVPGKKDCDACLAAEPVLSTRTWREVKYFVHNTIQSLKRRGLVVASKQSDLPESETRNTPHMDWDGPVYLSL